MSALEQSEQFFRAALWETYCEDVLVETADELIGATEDPHLLPVAIRRAVAKT